MTPSTTRAAEPLIRVGADFENEYPGAETLATECFANIWRTAELLMGLHNRHTLDQYQLSPSARGVLAVVEGAGQPLEPSVIAERLVVTTGSMTSLLDNLERTLKNALPHYRERGRSQLIVAFGCTGGRHRSVVMASEMAERLKHIGGVDVEFTARDINV